MADEDTQLNTVDEQPNDSAEPVEISETTNPETDSTSQAPRSDNDESTETADNADTLTPAETAETPEADEDAESDETLEAQELEDSANEAPEESAADIAEEEEAAEKEAEEEKEVIEEVEAEEEPVSNDDPNAKWYVVHTFSGHENRVATTLRQRIESEHLENRIYDILVPTQDKIEIRSGKKETVKEKIFPGYILVKMVLDDQAWLAVRTTQGVTAFVGMNNKPTPIPDKEVQSIVKFMTQGAAPTFKDVFMVDDTVKIVDGPFTDFIGKVDSVDKEKGKVRILVSIFGRETPVELDFLQVTKL
jgi:transcriptional antiterminator NusG